MKVTIDPNVRSGEPCVLNTRFPVNQLVAELTESGIQDVANDAGLDLKNCILALEWVTEALAEKISEYDMGPEPIINGRAFWYRKYPDRQFHVYVKNVGNPDPDGPDRWAIRGVFGSLAKDGSWEREGLPSSRAEKFYEECRYASAGEAILYYRRWRTAVESWCSKKMSEKSDTTIVVHYHEIPADLKKF